MVKLPSSQICVSTQQPTQQQASQAFTAVLESLVWGTDKGSSVLSLTGYRLCSTLDIE